MKARQKSGARAESYSLEDFAVVDKIDMHVHINTTETMLVDLAERHKFKLLTVNADYSEFPPIDEQLLVARTLRERFPKRVAYASTFTMNGWDDVGWPQKTIGHIDSTVRDGACAVKVWKNVGMDFRENSGRLVMVDDQGFDPIFQHLNQKNIPLIGHQGEPRACWLPEERITVKYLRDYFHGHPQYHMFLQPTMPSYEDQIRARDKMLERNKGVSFVGAHLASLEWSVDMLAQWLGRFSGAYADTAARVGDLQDQSVSNWDGVRQFFIRYQDRMMYATDSMQQPGVNSSTFQDDVLQKWRDDWEFLCTDATITVADIAEPVKGLHLPKTVVDKIYRTNAERVFRAAHPWS